jgi:hypothetical protein
MDFDNTELGKQFTSVHKEYFNMAKGEYFDSQRMNRFQG